VCIDIVSGGPVHYELPMDSVEAGNRIVNPSGLDARVSGLTTFVSGARRRGLLVDGRDSFVRVSGAAHRHECFGDLDNCPSGERRRRSLIINSVIVGFININGYSCSKSVYT